MTEFAKTVPSATNAKVANACAATTAANAANSVANAAANIDAVQQSEGTFAYQNVHLHYVRWASNTSANIQAPIILLHGFAQSAESWEEIASQLALSRTVYALDLIGHGKSDCPDDAAAYALDFQADALCSFMDYVSRETLAEKRETLAEQHETPAEELNNSATAGQSRIKPIVVGYSMGGRVALAAAVRSPEKFGALVLESAGLGPATEQDREAAAASDTARAESLRTDGLEVFMDAWEKLPLFSSQAHLPQETQAAIRSRRLANNAEALACTFENAGQHCMPDRTCVLDALRNAEFPVLYICGALDEKYCALADILGNAKVSVQIIDGVGHNVHLEDPAHYIGVLEAFLDAN